jgi:hypothetical protein
MYLLFIIFFILNFINFFFLFQSETFILFLSFFLIVSFAYAFFNINLKNIYLENLKWIETVRFYIIISNWHKSYIRLNELKVVKFYNLVQALEVNLFIKLRNMEKDLINLHYNNLKKTQLLRLNHLEKKLRLHKEKIRLEKKNLKYKLLAGNI